MTVTDGERVMDAILHGVFATLRRLRRHPGYALGVIATFALGIASVVAVWTLVHAVLLRPLDVPGGERVLSIVRENTSAASLGLPNVVELRQRIGSLEAVSAVFDDFAMDRTDTAQPLRLSAQLVEADYFRVVASQALLGRLLTEADDLVGAEPVAVLAESYWRRAFAADTQVLGRTLELSGVSVQIVGVVADRADVRERGPQLWAPIPPFAPWAPQSPGSNNFEVVARLAADSDLDSAREELRTVSTRLAQANGTPHKILDALPLRELLTESARPGLWALLAAVGVLLLLALANVSALMLVQVSRRREELGVRCALGADRSRLIRLMLAEGLLLAGLGSAIGVVLAQLMVSGFQAQAGWPIPRLAGAEIDQGVLLLTLLLSAGCALLFSAWPAWRASRQSASLQPRATSGRADQRTLSALMAVEVALACALLGVAALLARSFLALNAVPLGFDPAPVISADVVLPEARYSERQTQSTAFVQMVEHLSAQPGVAAAAMVVGPPLSSTQRIGHDLLIEGRQLDNGNARYRPFVGDYFGALGLPLLSGRGYLSTDGRGEAVAWVNQRFVSRYLPDSDPVGQRIAWPAGQAGPSEQPQWMRIVGVVADVRSDDLRADEVPAVYAPYLQREASWIRFGTLLARAEGAPMDLAPAMQQALSSADSAVAIGEISALAQRAEQVLAQDRVLLQLVAGFAALALLLGLQGVISVVAFAAQRRRRELGVRMALGATPGRAAAVLLRQTLLQLLLGVGAGVALLLAAERLLAGIVFGVQASDPLALALAAGGLICAALLAASWPAWRARRQELTQVLRAE